MRLLAQHTQSFECGGSGEIDEAIASEVKE
jgi:hypothetical protein